MVHEGKKQFACSLCSSAFSTKQSLKIHIESVFMKGGNHLHVLFVLQHFLRNVISRHILKVFMKTRNHLPIQFVLQNFLEKTLKIHIGMVHEGKKPFACPVCSSAFSTKPTLKTHIENCS